MSEKKIYIETYGCQMNLADTELVQSILLNNGFGLTNEIHQADAILVNTCSVREGAEERIYGRLGNFHKIKRKNPDLVVGILGCMAERLKKELIESNDIVDIIIGPDEYRKVPELLEGAFNGHKGIAVKLSRVETYDDIIPYREDGVSAWISVMRGCDKFCSFCVVPYTRGRERSRKLESIVNEVILLNERGFKEVNLLGQNVNSYRDGDNDFADLLQAVANISKEMRIRFTTSHPWDLSDKLLETIAANSNICNYIHLPFQSGSNRILELMNRNYTIEHYLSLIEKARKIIPGVSFSTDVIAGFPTEKKEDHLATLKVIEEVRFDGAFMFKYSPREKTKAYSMIDDVPEEVKLERLAEIIDLQRKISEEINNTLIGKTFEVLIEGESKKSDDYFMGRTDTNKVVIFPKENYKIGDYVWVNINKSNAATLFGNVVAKEKTDEIVINL